MGTYDVGNPILNVLYSKNYESVVSPGRGNRKTYNQKRKERHKATRKIKRRDKSKSKRKLRRTKRKSRKNTRQRRR